MVKEELDLRRMIAWKRYKKHFSDFKKPDKKTIQKSLDFLCELPIEVFMDDQDSLIIDFSGDYQLKEIKILPEKNEITYKINVEQMGKGYSMLYFDRRNFENLPRNRIIKEDELGYKTVVDLFLNNIYG